MKCWYHPEGHVEHGVNLLLKTFHRWISNQGMSTILLALVGVFFAYDIYVDLSANGPDSHLWLEFVFFILILMRLIYEVRTFSKLTEELSEEKTRTANLSGQLNEYISSHFEQWDLSKSEKEIA